jgi:hypothetical protein
MEKLMINLKTEALVIGGPNDGQAVRRAKIENNRVYTMVAIKSTPMTILHSAKRSWLDPITYMTNYNIKSFKNTAQTYSRYPSIEPEFLVFLLMPDMEVSGAFAELMQTYHSFKNENGVS